MKMYTDLDVGKAMIRKIDFDTKFTIISNIKGKKIKHVLNVVGICETGIITLREK